MLSSWRTLTAADGTSVTFVCASAVRGRARAPASNPPMIKIRSMRLSHGVTGSAGFDACGIDLDGHARLQQVDRENEPPLVRLLPDEHPFDANERPLDDAHAIALVEVRVREERHARSDKALDGLDF